MSRVAGKAKLIAEEDAHRAQVAIKEAVRSGAYLYPIKGIWYFVAHKELWKPLTEKSTPTLTTTVAVTCFMFIFTYVPQAAVLAFLNGPLAVVSAVFVVLSESSTIASLISRRFFVEEALFDTFDATLICRSLPDLVAHGRAVKPHGSGARDAVGRLGRMFKKPFELTPSGMLRYFMYLPLNLIPLVGPLVYLVVQGRRDGPRAHRRYFQLKGLRGPQIHEWVEKRAAEYTSFGVVSTLLEMIPFASMVFAFTNTVGAALWAADLEQSSRGPNYAPEERVKAIDKI